MKLSGRALLSMLEALGSPELQENKKKQNKNSSQLSKNAIKILFPFSSYVFV
jgi:hypothetical protein